MTTMKNVQGQKQKQTDEDGGVLGNLEGRESAVIR
jgi:hypothetical protein